MEFPKIEMGGNCLYNWEHKGPPPPQKEAPFQHLGFNRGFPQGWVGFCPLPSLPPSEAGRSSSLTSCPWRQVLQSICTLFQV